MRWTWRPSASSARIWEQSAAFHGGHLSRRWHERLPVLERLTTSVNSATRTWNDVNGNYVADCNLTLPAANGDCAPIGDLLGDVRLSRIFRVGRARVQGMFDVYNVLNASSILSTRTRYGPAWLDATGILAGRMVKFGAQLEF